MRTGMDLVTAWEHLADYRWKPVSKNGSKTESAPDPRLTARQNEQSLQALQQMMGGISLK